MTREDSRPQQVIRRNLIKEEDNIAPEFNEVPVVFARGTGVGKQTINSTLKFIRKWWWWWLDFCFDFFVFFKFVWIWVFLLVVFGFFMYIQEA